jgi:hypothetical protein
MNDADARHWQVRAQRFRAMSEECRALAFSWPDAFVASTLANVATELENIADAMLERART